MGLRSTAIFKGRVTILDSSIGSYIEQYHQISSRTPDQSHGGGSWRPSLSPSFWGPIPSHLVNWIDRALGSAPEHRHVRKPSPALTEKLQFGSTSFMAVPAQMTGRGGRRRASISDNRRGSRAVQEEPSTLPAALVNLPWAIWIGSKDSLTTSFDLLMSF